MARMRRAALTVALLVSVSVLAADTARGDRETVSPAQTVRSKDGGLTVSAPRGALSKPARIRIRTLTRAQFPPELRTAKVKPGSRLYELEPSGLRFLKPVTITRRLDTRVAGFRQNAVRGVVLASRNRSGKWELLKNLSARLNGRTLVVKGTTRHFSTLLSLDEGFSMWLVPAAVDATVGEKWEARFSSEVDNRRRRDAIFVRTDKTQWSASGAVSIGPKRTYVRQGFACARVGTGLYTAQVTVAEVSLAVFLGSLGGRYTETLPLVGRARCKAAAPTVLELLSACVAVAHTPLGLFPSFLSWRLGFRRASLPAGARAELTVAGMNGGRPVSAAIDRATGKVELQGGIGSYGPKRVQRLAVAGRNLTQQLVAKTAPAPTVTSEQGVIAGSCP